MKQDFRVGKIWVRDIMLEKYKASNASKNEMSSLRGIIFIKLTDSLTQNVLSHRAATATNAPKAWASSKFWVSICSI